MCKTICMNRKVELSGWQALERIPENCGCGGRATVCRGSTNPPYFWVECEDCHVSTMAAMKLTEAEAIAVWNRAVGGVNSECGMRNAEFGMKREE